MANVQESAAAERPRRHIQRHKSSSAQREIKSTRRQSSRLQQPSPLPDNGVSTSGGKINTKEAKKEPNHIDTIASRLQKRARLEEQDSPSPTEPLQRRTRRETHKQPPQKQPRKRRAEEEQHKSQPSKRCRTVTRTRDVIGEGEKSRKTHISESSLVDDWMGGLPESFPSSNMFQHRLAERKSSTSSLRRKRSGSLSSIMSMGPAEQNSRDGKSIAYAHKGYQMRLKTVGVLLELELTISDDSNNFCQSLLMTECDIPENTLLNNEIYRTTIADLQERNESRVIQDVGRLFVPSVQTLAKISEKRFQVFVESVNEAWDCCYPLIDPRPQSDYAVGIGRSGLTEARIQKLKPLIKDDPACQSDLMSTYYMYFPFFSVEVKCGTAGLVIAERQNAHSMGVSIHSLVTIHRLARREHELHNKPVIFSVAHDHRTIRLTAWGAVIDGNFYTVHPLAIESFDVTARRGRDRWTCYKFTFGVYEYGLTLLDKINAIIDELPPGLNLEKVAPLKLGLNTGIAALLTNRSGLSQQVDAYNLSDEGENLDSQQSSKNSRESTPATSTHMDPSAKRQKG